MRWLDMYLYDGKDGNDGARSRRWVCESKVVGEDSANALG